MIWISTQPAAFPVIYIDKQGAGIGTIQRAYGVSNLRHIFDYSRAGNPHLLGYVRHHMAGTKGAFGRRIWSSRERTLGLQSI
jgi:hypothetical protein